MNKLYQYWKDRELDWKKAYWTPEHPHRDLIVEELKRFDIRTIYELGCGAGANLYRISKAYPLVEYGGMDINMNACIAAREFLPKAHVIDCGTYDSIPFSDKSVDVLMTDAALIYSRPAEAKAVLKEMVRVARRGLLLCEADNASAWERFRLRYSRNDTSQPKGLLGKIKKRLTMGYNAHDYEKILTELGCYSIKKRKITNWPDGMWEKFGYVITCKI